MRVYCIFDHFLISIFFNLIHKRSCLDYASNGYAFDPSAAVQYQQEQHVSDVYQNGGHQQASQLTEQNMQQHYNYQSQVCKLEDDS